MPITSVYEDGLVFHMKNDIGSTRQLLDVRLEIRIPKKTDNSARIVLEQCFAALRQPFSDWFLALHPWVIRSIRATKTLFHRVSSGQPDGDHAQLRLAFKVWAAYASQTSIPIRRTTRQRDPSRNPTVAEPHPRSNAPISVAARHLLCARRIENHRGTLEDEPPRAASTLCARVGCVNRPLPGERKPRRNGLRGLIGMNSTIDRSISVIAVLMADGTLLVGKVPYVVFDQVLHPLVVFGGKTRWRIEIVQAVPSLPDPRAHPWKTTAHI